jgi:hypothetical protein
MQFSASLNYGILRTAKYSPDHCVLNNRLHCHKYMIFTQNKRPSFRATARKIILLSFSIFRCLDRETKDFELTGNKDSPYLIFS